MPISHRSSWLYGTAISLTVCTFFLLIAGGLVTSTGSGLSVPDWPLSYGKLMPPMVGGIFYEHGHRMIATFVGMLTIIVAGWIWRVDDRGWLRWTSALAVLLVIVQGVLGGLTVLLLLPTAISTSHATIAQIFFCMTILIAFALSPWWRTPGGTRSLDVSRSWLVAPFAVVMIQLILGALMRHSHAGVAIPDYPLAYGQILPSLSPESLVSYSDQLTREGIRSPLDSPVTAWQVGIHMAHRLWGLVTAGVVVLFALKLREWRVTERRLGTLGTLLGVLLLVQLTLGILTVLTRKDVGVTTAHQSTGALLLGFVVLATLHTLRIRRPTGEVATSTGGSA